MRWLKCATFSGPHRGYRCQARAGQTISCAAWPMVYDDVDVWTQLPRILTRNADYLAITRISVGLQTHNHMMRGNQGIAFLFFSVFFRRGPGNSKSWLRPVAGYPGGPPSPRPLPAYISLHDRYAQPHRGDCTERTKHVFGRTKDVKQRTSDLDYNIYG